MSDTNKTPTVEEQLLEALDENKKLKALNEELEVKLAEYQKAKPELKLEYFTYDKKKYEVRHGINIPGMGARTPLEITQDKDAQKWLVENGSGVIREKV